MFGVWVSPRKDYNNDTEQPYNRNRDHKDLVATKSPPIVHEIWTQQLIFACKYAC